MSPTQSAISQSGRGILIVWGDIDLGKLRCRPRVAEVIDVWKDS